MARLEEIAQQLQRSGHIVVESPGSELQTVPKPEERELPPLPQIFGNSMWSGAADELVRAVHLSADTNYCVGHGYGNHKA